MKINWCIWLGLAGASALPAAGVPAYNIQTVAGSSFIGDGGPATAAQIGTIKGMAVDAKGNLYLSDTDNNRVRKVDTAGVITTFAGNGTAGFSGDGGQAASAEIQWPYGLAVDSKGNVYIADFGNNRVRMVSPAGIITTVAGNGTEGYNGDYGLAADAWLYGPRNVVLDAAGNLYISEFEGQRVRMVTPATATLPNRIYTFAGTGVAGAGTGTPIGAPLSTTAQLSAPAGLAVDSAGAVYIADSGNSRVLKVIPATLSSAGGIISTVANLTAQPMVANVTDIAVSGVGQSLTIYVAGGGGTGFFTARARGYFSISAGVVPSSTIAPSGLAIDLAGDVFVAVSIPQVWRWNASVIASAGTGTPSPATLVAGDGYVTEIGDGGPATISADCTAGPDLCPGAILHHPSAVALDTSGNLFIADTGTQRVREVTPCTIAKPCTAVTGGSIVAGAAIRTIAGTGTASTANDYGLPAAEASLSSPMGVAVDPSNNLFVADTWNSRVMEITAPVTGASIIFTFAGTGVAGLGQDGSTPSATPLDSPGGVCTGSDGSVYIVDTGNNRVLVVPPDGVVTTFAGNGGKGNVGDGYYPQYAQLDRPGACTLDASGNLYIADTYNYSIRKVAPGLVNGVTHLVIATVAGTGAQGFSGDGGVATAAALNAPSGVAADSYGNIFIADTGNHAIRLVTPDGLIRTIAGQGGTPGFAGDNGAAANALLNSPSGMVLDGAGDLYFADSGNNRVRRLTPGYAVTVGTAPLSALSLVSAASLIEGSVAPGEIVTIYGLGIGPDSGVSGSANASGAIGTLLAGAQVFFDGVPAPLFYAQATQINAQVPYTIAGENFTRIVVSYQGQLVSGLTVAVAPSVPGLFAVAFNQDGGLNSASAPAARGSVVTFVGSGEGLTNGPNVAGQAAVAPYPAPTLPVTLTVDGIAAELLYAGEAPNYWGLLQVNAIMPGGLIPSGAEPVQLVVGVAASPTITVWLE
jgi:uncharacterized protein (TIGR03437 family)